MVHIARTMKRYMQAAAMRHVLTVSSCVRRLLPNLEKETAKEIAKRSQSNDRDLK